MRLCATKYVTKISNNNKGIISNNNKGIISNNNKGIISNNNKGIISNNNKGIIRNYRFSTSKLYLRKSLWCEISTKSPFSSSFIWYTPLLTLNPAIRELLLSLRI